MKMFTKAANDMREINTFVNENRIPQENIVNIFQSKDGIYMLVYFTED